VAEKGVGSALDVNASTGRHEMADSVEDFFEQDGTRRALSRRRNRKQANQRVGEREEAARRREKMGSRLEIGQADNTWTANVERNALLVQPVSQAIPQGSGQSRIGSFYQALAQNRVNPQFVERPAPADDEEPPDLRRFLTVI
jgi:hypothetical protein